MSKWQLVPGVSGQTFKQISVGSGAYIWAVTASGSAYRYRTTLANPSNPNDKRLKYEWVQAPAPASGVVLTNISVGMDGTVYAVDRTGHIYTTSSGGSSGGQVDDNKKQIMLPWTPVAGSLAQVSVGDDSLVWGVNSGAVIWRAAFTGGNLTWQHIQGSLKWVSVAGDGTVYGITPGNKILKYEGAKWIDVPGSLTQISVGADSVVWGVNASQAIYQWNGRNGWTLIPGALVNISVGADSVVYGVNQNGQVYVYVVE